MSMTNCDVKKKSYKNEFRRSSSYVRAATLGVSLIALVGCQTTGFNFPLSPASEIAAVDNTVMGIPEQDTAIQALVRKSASALKENKLKEASQSINLALKLDITNPDLQFLNGLTYHMMGVRGDASKYELAEQGYNQSLKFDPGNLSAQYQLGLLYMDQRRYGLAQGHFAAVALHLGDDPSVLYSLASASYYARDPKTSEAALKRLMVVAPNAKTNPRVLKAAALTLSAMDDREGAAEFVAAYKNAVTDTQDALALNRRVNGWQSFYDSDAKVLLAQFDPYSTENSDSYSMEGSMEGNDPYATDEQQIGAGAQQSAEGSFADTSMVVVDVVLIGTQEDVRDSRGINLLNGLQLQFGDPLSGTVGFGLTSTRTNDGLGSGLAQQTKTITRSISIPAVTYSLNIANSLNANNQVLAKPSLVAQTGQTSEFFSGTEILAAAVSGGSGDSVSVQKEVGVKLAVTPEILPNDMVRLHIVAERTFLTDPSNSVVFEFRLDTSKTTVNSTVTMKFGETLILAGLSERETSKSVDGVPGLMDIPILDYLFSQRVERQFERSIMILLTPRRPHYTRQSASDREENNQKMSDLERELQRLERRHGDWYTPRSTFNMLKEKFQTREFFEEFRNGDVLIQSWNNDPAGQNHIVQVQQRLLGQQSDLNAVR